MNELDEVPTSKLGGVKRWGEVPTLHVGDNHEIDTNDPETGIKKVWATVVKIIEDDDGGHAVIYAIEPEA